MTIEVYKMIQNPLPIAEGCLIEISDEEIIKIGKRYFELMNEKAQIEG